MVFAVVFVLRFTTVTIRDWVSPCGVRIAYYNDGDFKERIAMRPLRALEAYYQHAPAHGVRSGNFYARAEGWLGIRKSGKYAFATLSHGGLRLYLDERLLVDSWKEQPWGRSGNHADDVELSEGYHRLRVDYFVNGGPGRFKVEWCGPGIPPRSVVDADYLRKDKP